MLFYQLIVFNELKNKKALIIRNILKLGIIPVDMRGGYVWKVGKVFSAINAKVVVCYTNAFC